MPVVLLPFPPLTSRTALQLIQDALGLTNAVGTDQTLTANEAADCLRKLNDLIEIFSINSLAVYGLGNQTFNTVNGQGVYTVGAGGNWNTNRPVRINGNAYSTINGATFPCVSITQGEYDEISNKAQAQQYPDCFLYVNEFPMGLVTLWPVPNAITPVTFSMDMLINSVPTVATTLEFPPGYMMAFTYKLGIMLAPLFGKKIVNYPDIVKIANDSFGDIKRSNMSQKKRVMRCDPAYSDSGSGAGDWQSG